jgi:hypothetical protein
LPSGPSKDEQRRKAEKAEADRDFVAEKNLQTLRRRQLTEVKRAKRRGELIQKTLVQKQAAYLLVALRQAILNLPAGWARRMVSLPDANAASKFCARWRLAC